jgi:hypothetical protein
MKINRHFSKKPIDDAKLRRLWSSRISDCDLAKMLGCHPWTVRRRAMKLGLRLRRKIWAETS